MKALITKIIRPIYNVYNFIRWPKLDVNFIIWSPGSFLIDKIVNDLNAFVKVNSVRKFEIEESRMNDFIIDLYAIDRASPAKIKNKIDRLLVPPFKMYEINTTLKWPGLKAHCNYNSWLKSPKVNNIKKVIREKYSHLIDDYKYDVIIHSTETEDQLDMVDQLIKDNSKYIAPYCPTRFLENLVDTSFTQDDYCLINSIWLPLMGIRSNGDLDLVVEENKFQQMFNSKADHLSRGVPGKHENRMRIHGTNCPYLEITNSKSFKEIIENHTILHNNVRYIYPRFYFQYKLERLNNTEKLITEMSFIRRRILKDKVLANKNTKKLYKKFKKDSNDIVKIKKFFAENKHLGSTLPKLSEYQWGKDLF